MKAVQEIERMRKGGGFYGDVTAFHAIDPESVDLLGQELRNGPDADFREKLVKVLLRMGTSQSPDAILENRQILATVIQDGSLRDDCAYLTAMEGIAESAPGEALAEFGKTFAKLAESRPNSGLFLVIAKAKTREATPALRKRSEESEWKDDLSLRIALAALGDKTIEDQFIKDFETTDDADTKMRSAEILGRIGTRKALEALAHEMRSPLVATIPATFMKSVRPDIAKAIQYNYPKDRFLLVVNSDADYERIENFCEKEFGTTWKSPRPPFLNIQPLAPTP